jgi:hypothetical protein
MSRASGLENPGYENPVLPAINQHFYTDGNPFFKILLI